MSNDITNNRKKRIREHNNAVETGIVDSQDYLLWVENGMIGTFEEFIKYRSFCSEETDFQTFMQLFKQWIYEEARGGTFEDYYKWSTYKIGTFYDYLVYLAEGIDCPFEDYVLYYRSWKAENKGTLKDYKSWILETNKEGEFGIYLLWVYSENKLGSFVEYQDYLNEKTTVSYEFYHTFYDEWRNEGIGSCAEYRRWAVVEKKQGTFSKYLIFIKNVGIGKYQDYLVYYDEWKLTGDGDYPNYLKWVKDENKNGSFVEFLDYVSLDLKESFQDYLDYYDQWTIEGKGFFSTFVKWNKEGENKHGSFKDYSDYESLNLKSSFSEYLVYYKDWTNDKIGHFDNYVDWIIKERSRGDFETYVGYLNEPKAHVDRTYSEYLLNYRNWDKKGKYYDYWIKAQNPRRGGGNKPDIGVDLTE